MKKLFIAIAMLAAAQAQAVVTYGWEGTCVLSNTGCSSVDYATGTLVLEDTYTPGTVAAQADFRSFDVTAGSMSLSFGATDTFQAFTPFPTAAQSPAPATALYFSAANSSVALTLDIAGLWSIVDGAGVTLAAGNHNEYTLRDSGGSGNEVPLPAAAWLFGSALIGLGAVARTRTK
jgi:hypothetical protein